MSRTSRALIGGTFVLSALLAIAAVVVGTGELSGTETTLALFVTVASSILGAVMLGGDRFEIL
jgi:hypothetical protein